MRLLLSRIRAGAALVALLAVTWAAQGQTWTGLAAPDNNWTTVGNWDTGVPVSGSTAFFTGAGNGNVSVSLGGATQQVGAIEFDTSSAAAYTLGVTAGDTLSITNNNISSTVGAISVTSVVTNPQAITAAISFTGSTPLITNASAAAGLTLGASPGSATLAVNSATSLTINATTGATITINDVITGSVGGTVSGATATGGLSTGTTTTGTLIFNSQSTYTGLTNLNGTSGTLTVAIGSSTDTVSNSTYTKGPFGVGPIAFNGNGHQTFLEAYGGNQTIANPVAIISGDTISNAAIPFNLTLSGPISMATSGRTITIDTYGQTFTLGSAAAPSTLTLSATTGLNLGLNPAYSPTLGGAATLVINDVIQDPPTPPAVPTTISYNSNSNTVPEGFVIINGENTYAGNTIFTEQTSGSLVVAITIQIGVSSVLNGTAIVSGPFGQGTLVPTVSTTFAGALPPVFESVGADQTVANAVSLASGGFWVANATSAQDPSGPHNLTLSGPIAMGTAGKTITNNMVSGVALTLGTAAAPSTITLGSALTIQSMPAVAGANGGLTIINDLIQDGSTSAGSLIVQGGGTVQLTNANTFSGGVAVTGGTLLLKNTSGSATGPGPVAVTGSGTLGSGGTLGGAGSTDPGALVTVSSTFAAMQGGIVYPGPGGNSAGTLTVGSMSFQPLGRYVAHSATDTTVGGGINNFISGSGTLDLSTLSSTSPFDLNLLPLSFGTGGQQTYVIANFTGGITGAGGTPGTPFSNGADISSLFTLSGAFSSAPAMFAMVVAGTGGTSAQAIQLSFTPVPVPEPTFIVTACGGLTALATWRRRRRS